MFNNAYFMLNNSLFNISVVISQEMNLSVNCVCYVCVLVVVCVKEAKSTKHQINNLGEYLKRVS